MKWIKRLLKLLAGLLLGSALIVTASILVLEESDYKRLLGWGAERFLDSQLIIEGPLSVDISRNLALYSSDILLKSNDDNYRLSVGNLRVSFRLSSYLQTGTFWFNNLELENINLEVNETAENNGFSFEDFSIPPVIVEQAHFNNLEFAYQELPPGSLHRFSLDELKLKEMGEQQPVSLRASGKFMEQPFELLGKTDSISQLVEGIEPQDIQLKLSSTHINADIEGTIAEPLNGRGLDLQIKADIPQVRDIIEIVWDEIPVLGSLKGSFFVRGDYTAPRLEEIDLHIQRGKEADLKVKGSVLDVRSGTGMDLQLEGMSSNPKVLSWLLFNKYNAMQTFQVSGRLKGDKEQFSFQELKAQAETVDEVKLNISGNASIHPDGYRLMRDDAGLFVEFSSPTTEAANLLGVEGVPELGPISGSLKLALSMDAVGVYDLDVGIGSSKQNKALLKGDIGYVQLVKDLNLSELKLQTDFQVANIAKFGKQLGYELPALGSGQLRGLLVTQASELILQDANLDIGTKGQSALNATGLIATQLREPKLENIRLAMDVDLQANEVAQLGQQLDYELPKLGPLQLRSKLITQASELLFKNTSLAIGKDGHSILHANGMFATQLRDPKNFRVAMNVDIQASEFARLAEPFDYTLPELGPTQITGWFESANSELHFKDGLLVVGATGQPTIRTDFKLTTQLQKGSTINAYFDVAVAQLIAAFSDLQPKNLGRLQGEAVIADLDGDWGIEHFSLASTQTNLYQLQLSGSYDDMEHYDKAKINSSLVIDSPAKLGETLGMDLSGLGAFRQQGLLSSKKGHIFYDGKTSLGSTNSKTEISGYLKDGKPVFEGSVNIPVLYLADFGFGSPGKDESESSKDKSTSPHVFSRELLDFEFLYDVDFDLLVSIDKVESEKFRIDSIKGQLELENGHLTAPLLLMFEGGNTDINLDIRAGAVPEFRLTLTSDDVSLGPLMSQVTNEVPIEGYSNLQLDLQARGKTPHEMASSLSGNVNLGLENARIPRKHIELLSVNVLDWALSKSVAKKSHYNLNCLVLTFAINAGEVKSETIIADGPNISVGGKIDMNLGEETLNIVLLPKQKKRVFASATPVKVHGPMKKPKVDAIPAKAAIQEIGTMTLLPGVLIPLRATEKLWSLLSDGDKVGGGCDSIDALREPKNK